MKTFKNILRVLMLRPALYNGHELIAQITFENARLNHVDYAQAKALDLKPGDTAEILAKVSLVGDDNFNFCFIYMSEEILGKFIDAYGCDKVNAKLKKAKLRFIYTIYDKYNSDTTKEEKDELMVYQLIDFEENE